MANILYYPQLSMYDKTTKELLPQSDGNVNMLRNTILEWQKHRPNDKFYILLPSELYCKIKTIIPNGTINCYPLFYNSFVVSARINRFNFPMQEFTYILKLLLQNTRIDLVITDVIELARNIKAMFNVRFGYTPKVISNIRHVDDKNTFNSEYDYTLRIIDGIQCSDLVTILSDSMKLMIYDSMKKYLNDFICETMYSKIITFEPSISYNELKEWYEKIKPNSIKKITFPGRLSKGEEKRTNWDKFQKAIINLREQRQDFEVYFTDPNNSMTKELKDNLKDWVKTIDKNRNQFLNLLNNTDIVVSLMDVEGFGGISIREALLFDCIPIIPWKHEYKKMAEAIYPGFIEGEITSEKIVKKLNWALDLCNTNFNVLGHFKKYGMQFTVEEQMQNLIKKVEEIL